VDQLDRQQARLDPPFLDPVQQMSQLAAALRRQKLLSGVDLHPLAQNVDTDEGGPQICSRQTRQRRQHPVQPAETGEHGSRVRFWNRQLKEGFDLGPPLAAEVNRSSHNLDRNRRGEPGSLHGPPKPLQLDNALHCDERLVATQNMTAAVDEHRQVVHAAEVALHLTQTKACDQTSHRGIGRSLAKRHTRMAAHPAADQRMSRLFVTPPTHPTDPPLPQTKGQALLHQ
jgi:hypothetical protein